MENKARVKIVIAMHKKYKVPSGNCYIPLHVGAEGKKDNDGKPLDLGYIKDNSGDNISILNSSFCELTGLYWAWKNIDADYIGLVHYRRHFSYKKKSKEPFKNVLNDAEIDSIIKTNSIIVPKQRRYYIETLYSHYKHTHFSSQMDETRKIIQEKYPKYIDDYDRVLKRRWGYMFNMMIMRKDLLDSYCEWLFNILFELKKRVDKGLVENSNNLSYFQGRFYGRISEIIFNVWIEYQLRVKKITAVKELKCISMEKIAWKRKIKSFLAAKYFGKKYERSF